MVETGVDFRGQPRGSSAAEPNVEPIEEAPRQAVRAPGSAPGTQQAFEQVERADWQRKLLPLMAVFLVLGAIFFAVMSVFELRDLYARVAHQPFDLADHFAEMEAGAPAETLNDPAYTRFKVLALLEAEALQRRYHQANATMLGRIWTRQLGFLTGMLLALVGAAFILGRLQEPPTKLELASEQLKGALATSSPGILLAVLGSGLMALTLWIPFGVETIDANTYLRNPPQAAAAQQVTAPPNPFLPETIDGAGPLPAPDEREKALFGSGDATPAGPPSEGGAQ